MEPLTYLAAFAAVTAGLNVLGGMTAWAKSRHMQRHEDTQTALSLPPAHSEKADVAPSAMTAADEEATAGYWWKRLLSLPSMFGLFAGPVQVPILVINSALIAATLETVLKTSGEPLIAVHMAGWDREITNLDLIGVLISLGQMLAAAGLHLGWSKRLWFPFALASLALPPLVVFETWASFERGWLLDGSFQNAILSALQALGIAALAGVVGCFLIDHFLLPLALAVCWSVAAPCRCLARWWGPQPIVRGSLASALVTPLVVLDPVFAPLRSVDRAVGHLIFGRRYVQEGDHHHATMSTIQHPAHEHQSTPDYGAARVWNGRRDRFEA